MTDPGAPPLPRLHLVTDDALLGAPDFLERAARVLEAGGSRVALHLRGPRSSGRALYELGLRLMALRSAARLLVNDRVDLALLLGAAGAHLPESGLPPAEARRILGSAPPRPLLGRSVHGNAEGAAEVTALDYLFVGTLFETPSHPGRPGAGVARIREVAAVAGGLPLIGIGGVTPERVPELLAAGAHGAAVLGGVWHAADPARAVEAFLLTLRGARG